MKGGKDSRDGKGGYDDGPGAMVPRDANGEPRPGTCGGDRSGPGLVRRDLWELMLRDFTQTYHKYV